MAKDEDSPMDTPPDYAAALASAGPTPGGIVAAGARATGDEKRPLPIWPPPATTPTASSSSAYPSSVAGPSNPLPSPRPAAPGSPFIDLFNPEYWRKRKEDEEIRGTVRSLLRDVIHDMSSPSTLDILHSCFHACASRGISFPALSQELIEEHTLLYWALLTLSQSVRSLPGGPLAAQPPESGWPVLELLTAFELSPQTQRDASVACMMGDDNALFQYLRRREAFEKRGLAESIASPLTAPLGDQVAVQHISDKRAGHFKIQCTISNWLRRVRMHKQITVSWVARGRAWALTFGVATDSGALPVGTWHVSLRLIRGSSPSSIDAEVLLGPGSSNPPEGGPSSSEAGEVASSVAGKQVALVFRTRELRDDQDQGCCVKLSSVDGAASLEYEDSPYISPDGSLHVEGDFVLEYSK